jgi:large subunit ribosomal protein L4
MKLSVINWTGGAAGEAEIADELLIKNGKGTQAVHDAVVGIRANRRLGTAKAKQMGEVAGSGKKPWKQKHTGRARAGSFQSPLWRGGAVTFGPRPRDYSKKVSKKTRTLALRKALSERLLAGDVIVVSELKLDSHKTKDFVSNLSKLGVKDATALVVTDVLDKNLKLASRNVAGVQVEPADSVNVLELLNFGKIVATKAALDKLTARMSK